jgi:single-strand DNA-binding protein
MHTFRPLCTELHRVNPENKRGREMAGSVNKVILVGNLGADPEIRRTQDGRPIANLRIATSETWRDKNTGERRERTEWHRVVIFSEGLAKVAEQYLKKGARIYIEGQLQTRKWQDQQGQERWSTEVVLQGFNSLLVMLDKAGGGPGMGARDDLTADNGASDYGSYADGSRSGMPAPTRQPATAGGSPRDDMNDEVPF